MLLLDHDDANFIIHESADDKLSAGWAIRESSDLTGGNRSLEGCL